MPQNCTLDVLFYSEMINLFETLSIIKKKKTGMKKLIISYVHLHEIFVIQGATIERSPPQLQSIVVEGVNVLLSHPV